jgi:hypothetical protein
LLGAHHFRELAEELIGELPRQDRLPQLRRLLQQRHNRMAPIVQSGHHFRLQRLNVEALEIEEHLQQRERSPGVFHPDGRVDPALQREPHRRLRNVAKLVLEQLRHGVRKSPRKAGWF